MASLLGTHYEGVSRIYRALGATVGARVYWPGSGLKLSGLFDLLEVIMRAHARNVGSPLPAL